MTVASLANTRLHELTAFSDERLLECSVLPVRKVFGDNYVWRNLEMFLFHGAPINGGDLMAFLGRHATTLKTFGLLDTHLCTGTWRGILDFIKEKPELHLEKLIVINASEPLHPYDDEIEYYSYSESVRMVDYVLHGGPPFPPAEPEKRFSITFFNSQPPNFAPTNSDDVAVAIKTLVGTDTPFAVKSGGHSSNPGWADINGGVLLTLSNLKSLVIQEGYVEVSVGNVWDEVYKFLDPLGLSAVGASVSGVGVGGYLLGGRLSYLSNERGWGCDNVKSFEVLPLVH
ncbi:hypothetical protein RUND412_002517 [Rhizina undulata]